MTDARYREKKVLIFGLGQWGGQIEAVRYFVRAGARVLATDQKGPEKLQKALEALAGLPVELRLGEHREEDFLGADLVVVSPAVPRSSRFLKLVQERGIPLTTELGLTLAGLKAPVLAVTGSNGKSTTTALLGRAVEAAGQRAWVGGNIGRPLLNDLDRIEPGDRAVLELSSFQLEDIRDLALPLAPELAIVLNLTPNHLDRHGSMEAYAAAKRTLVERVPAGGTVVLSREDPRVLGFARMTRGRVVTFGLSGDFPGEGAFLDDGWIACRSARGTRTRLLPARSLRIEGRHNQENALAVAAATLALGLDPGAVAHALASFEGLRDRLELVRERRGVRYLNDAKATTPEAAVAAIEAVAAGGPGPLTLIAGGADKGMDFRPLARAAARAVGRVLLIGETRQRLRDEIAAAASALGLPLPETSTEETLEAAVRVAAELAPPGGAVLFSPACASYDMFLSFEERGERFRALVRALEG